MAAEPHRKEILVIQTAFVGDLLLSIPLLKELARLYPGCQLTVLCRAGLGDFILRSELAQEVVEVQKAQKTNAKDRTSDKSKSWGAALRQLAGRKFALVICPHQSFRSALFVSRLTALRKIGYRRFFNRFVFSDRVERPMFLPEALRQLALLTPLDASIGTRLTEFARSTSAGGLNGGSLAPVPQWAELSVKRLTHLKEEVTQGPSLPSASSDSVRKIARSLNLIGKTRPVAVLAPGSVWATKMWKLDGYAEVARDLLKQGWSVLALGTSAERTICDRLASLAPGVSVIAGETKLYESAEIMALSDLVICNDSGAMHMAAAAATPSVSIFGPTVLELGYRPWQNSSRVVQIDLACRPCGAHGADTCPLGTHACMKGVTAAQVLTGVRELNFTGAKN